MFNADTDPATFVLPELMHAGHWRGAFDTARPSLDDADASDQKARP